ncbi:unnamed protein product, partial [Mesorhabditis belari]|uniref:Major facilitator superfamily (MFS) profile domain-containing protein n=1 Tax=Mesorhabditis belari TaxID=2138241 RepID=A0AAF3EEG6_9BILA
MAIIYLFMTISEFAVPTVIDRIGAKWSMTLGSIFYVFFLLGFLHLSAFLLYTLSALLGIGAALLWTASGVFLVEFSTDGQLTRNSGILWAMIQASLIPGAVFLTFLLQNEDLVSSYRLLYSVFTGFALFAVFTFLLLSMRPKNTKTKKNICQNFCIFQRVTESSLRRKTVVEDLLEIGRLMKSRKMGTLLVMFLYLGIESAFANGVYTGCLSATRRLTETNESVIAYAIFSIAFGHIIGASLFGMFSTQTMKFGRKSIIGIGLICHLVAYTLCLLILPFESPLANTWDKSIIEPRLILVLFTGFLLGFAGSCWHTQSLIMIGDLYKGPQLPSAIAIYRLCQSFAGVLVFLYSAHFALQWQLGIASLFAIIGYFVYHIVHQWATKEFESKNEEIVRRCVINEEIL